MRHSLVLSPQSVGRVDKQRNRAYNMFRLASIAQHNEIRHNQAHLRKLHMAVTRDTSQRRLQISELVRQEGSVQVSTLADRFGVSPQTVRKDLRYLAERGVMTRAYGGAIDSGVIGAAPAEPHYEAKRTTHLDEKRRIGARAAALRSEEHTSELQSRGHLVCRLLLEKK